MLDIELTTENCIQMRRSVMKFCTGIDKRSKLPNVIDEVNPALDVAGDYSILTFLNLLYLGHAEIERVKDAKMTDKNGKPQPIIRREVKMLMTQTEDLWRQIKTYIPMHDNVFVYTYSDFDDMICEKMQKLRTTTYYPILNRLLSENPTLNSDVLKVIASLMTAMIFTNLGGYSGLLGQGVKSVLVERYMDKINHMTAQVVAQYDLTIKIDVDNLSEEVRDCMRVVDNAICPIISQIANEAAELDLTDYVATADYTKTEWENLIKEIKDAKKKHYIQLQRRS